MQAEKLRGRQVRAILADTATRKTGRARLWGCKPTQSIDPSKLGGESTRQFINPGASIYPSFPIS
jgi:hypothetical protein